jgi:hypothetical protein
MIRTPLSGPVAFVANCFVLAKVGLPFHAPDGVLGAIIAGPAARD